MGVAINISKSRFIKLNSRNLICRFTQNFISSKRTVLISLKKSLTLEQSIESLTLITHSNENFRFCGNYRTKIHHTILVKYKKRSRNCSLRWTQRTFYTSSIKQQIKQTHKTFLANRAEQVVLPFTIAYWKKFPEIEHLICTVFSHFLKFT